MKTISIKEPHDRTGHWLRQVKDAGEVVVTEHGTPIARMLPLAEALVGHPFKKCKLLRGVARIMMRAIDGPDSATIISEMRDGR